MSYMSPMLVLASALLIGLALSGCDASDLGGPNAPDDTFGNARTDVASNFDADADDGSVDLVAGQNTKVGTVSWQDVEGGVEVTYTMLAGYCISEWHLDGGTVAGSTLTGIPVNGGGNPQIGRFEFMDSDAGCLTTVEQFVPNSSFEGGGDRVLAAHAVVTNNADGCDYFYGIAADGNIYQVSLGDLEAPGDETETLFYSTGLNSDAVAETWPNSLAYNATTDRLYYSNALAFGSPTGEGIPDPTAPLYFFDFGSSEGNVHAGDLSRRSASGTFAGGDLWYVPQNLDDNLRRVTFDGDGMIASDALVCEDFTGATGVRTRMFFGDVVFNPTDGLVYGSARIGDDNGPATFFSVDPATCAYTEVGTDLFLTQLTFDCSGNLIGFDTSQQTYLLIDPSDGSQTVIGTSEYAINDLAPGQCECSGDFNETAWGVGTRFGNRGSWAMYIVID